MIPILLSKKNDTYTDFDWISSANVMKQNLVSEKTLYGYYPLKFWVYACNSSLITKDSK